MKRIIAFIALLPALCFAQQDNWKDVYIRGGGLTSANSGTQTVVQATDVPIVQNVTVDTGNSSTNNLTSTNSYTFTGTGKSTLGVVGLQWNLKTDQNVTVYIEQSDDDSNWDISDSFAYVANQGGRGETIQATMAYWRIRVVGTTTTSYFRLSGILCPIATPLPSALTDDGRLKAEVTLTGKENAGRHVWVSPTLGLTVTERYRLVGTSFDGTNKNANFWTETVVSNATVTQAGGEIKLSTLTTANASAQYQTVQRARFVVGSPVLFFCVASLDTAPVADNLRRIGAYDSTDGFFFQVDGTAFSVAARKAGVDTVVTNGTFNGHIGATWNPVTSTYYQLAIEITLFDVSYYVDNILLHRTVGSHQANTFTLPVTMQNVNSGGNDVASVMDVVGASIQRQGRATTEPIFKYAGAGGLANATHVLKYGAGVLHRVTVTDNTGTLLVYDGLSAAGTLLASLDASKTVGTMEFEAPFSVGLTVVVASTPKMTIVFE
jgi:hypothetical protein